MNLDRLKEALRKASEKAKKTASNFYSGVNKKVESQPIGRFTKGVVESTYSNVKPFLSNVATAGKQTGAVGLTAIGGYDPVPDVIQRPAARAGVKLAEQALREREAQKIIKPKQVLTRVPLNTARAAATVYGIAKAPVMKTGLALSGLISGGIEKAFGGDFYRGAGKGVGQGFETLGFTSKVTDPVISAIANKPVGQIARRALTGAGNVVEDYILSKLDDTKFGAKEAAISAGVGAAISPKANSEMIKKIAALIKKFPDKFKTPEVKASIGDVRAKGSNQYQAKYKAKEPVISTNGRILSGGRLIRNPENPRQFLREGTTPTYEFGRPRTQEQALAATGGFEFEKDEKGNIKVKYNPAKGALAVGAVAGIKSKQGKEVLDLLSKTISKDITSPKDLPTTSKELEQILPSTAKSVLPSGEIVAPKVDATGMVDEAAAGRSAVADATRSMFTPDDISGFNRIKKMAGAKNVVEGDVENLRSKDPVAVDDAINRVREVVPGIETDSDAVDYIRNLPTKADTVPPKENFGRQSDVYLAEPTAKTQEKIASRKSLSAERQAKLDYSDYQKALFKQEGATRTPSQAAEAAARAIGKNTTSAATKDISQVKDISGFQAQTNDVYRNFEKAFGPKFADVKRTVLDPFDEAKGRFVDTATKMANDLDESIVKKLDIKKGSPESAAVQEFGEKQIDQAELVRRFGADKALKIVEADKWFRGQYDQLLEDINKVRKQIYPNDPSKIIPKKENYYRHFQEISTGISGLVNIFDTPANISSSLSGISEYMKPKSKWLSFAQRRLGVKTDVDAVGGFINFAKSFAYAKEIDPQIGRFRSLADELSAKTEEGPDAGRLNNFIEYLHDFSNDLSGKTNPADRFIQKVIPGGRKAFRVIDWMNKRIKSNVILGNLSSSVAQVFNIPQGIASAGKHSFKGASDTLAGVFKSTTPIDKSNFIKERYSSDVFDRFDTSMIDNAKKLAAWVIQVGDVVGTRFIWNSHYEKALAENISNPIKYADDLTRNLVAGRGIGEVPLLQKSKVFQMIAPFQLEVGNLWHVMGDWVDKKQFSKFATFSVAMYLMNRAAEGVRGSDVGFDPINALKEAGQAYLDEEDKGLGLMKAGGRITGEVLSNVPLGQTVASLYPEYGGKVGETQLPTRKDLFGKGDPTRFGSGLLVARGLQDPVSKLLPPFGGQQVKRTVEGLMAAKRGYSESKTGRVRFGTPQSPLRVAQQAAFGEYSTPQARSYFDNGGNPLGDKDSATLKEQIKSGVPADIAYSSLDARRRFTNDIDKYREEVKSGNFKFSGDDPKPAAEAVFRYIMDQPAADRAAAYKKFAATLPDNVKQEIFAIQKLDKKGLTGEDRILLTIPEEVRSRMVYERLMALSEKNRRDKYLLLVKEGVITEAMKPALFKLQKK